MKKMIEKGLLNQRDCSVDTIQRYIRKSGLRNSGNTTLTHERRAWEYAHACDGMKPIRVIRSISLMRMENIERPI